MKYYIIVLLIAIVFLLSCSGKDKITIDKIKPHSPKLIPHLGDLGDGYMFNDSQYPILDDDNNGIDAVPDGNGIRISWEHFLDSDLDFYKVYRFDENNIMPVLIDTRSVDDNDYYIDNSNDVITHIKYSYTIEVFDKAGNSTLSDTVSYKLLDKPIFSEPVNNAVMNPNGIVFKWNASGFVSKYRLLLFNDNHEYLWKYDMDVAFEGDSFEVTGPSNLSQLNPGSSIFWRVDAFEWDSDLGFFIGSESYERKINLDNN
jgi:hypothetical protein